MIEYDGVVLNSEIHFPNDNILSEMCYTSSFFLSYYFSETTVTNENSATVNNFIALSS